MLTERQQKSIFCDTETKTRKTARPFSEGTANEPELFCISVSSYFSLLLNDPIFTDMTDVL